MDEVKAWGWRLGWRTDDWLAGRGTLCGVVGVGWYSMVIVVWCGVVWCGVCWGYVRMVVAW